MTPVGLALGPMRWQQLSELIMEWTPNGLKGEYNPKDFVAIKVTFTALGYLPKMESGTLERTKPGEYRWHGPLKVKEVDNQGRVLYSFSHEAAEIT